MNKTLTKKHTSTLLIALLFFCSTYTAIAETSDSDVTVTDNNTTDKYSSDKQKPVLPTPQPPLIDAQPEPRYEPEITGTITDRTTNTDNSLTKEQPVDPTPQPPLIDAQPEASYEPDINSPTPESTNPASEDETIEAKQEQSIRWLDTRPTRVSADWLQLTSGEWLRGRVISMQSESLEFDSDELNNLDIDWDKVKYLKSYQPYSLRFDDNTIVIGAIEITQDKVLVKTDYDDEEFERKNLLIIASGKDTELSNWTAKVTLSLDVRRGNTDQTDFTTKANAKRRTLISRLILDYLANFTSVSDVETINNHRLNGTYDIFITRDFFWTVISAEYYSDPFQNIDQRINTHTALGYHLINNNKTEWDISAGPGYQETKYVSVRRDSESMKDSSFVIVFNTKFETEVNSKIDIEGSYSATLGDSSTGNYTHHSLLTVETELTDTLDFDVTAIWDRTQEPVPDIQNITPEQDDLRIMIGLGYEL